MSNNVQQSSAGVYQPLALVRPAISYAGQLTDIKPVDRQDTFGMGVKGLYVYGSKVVRPYALGTCAATIG
jgi:hypothetical protein